MSHHAVMKYGDGEWHYTLGLMTVYTTVLDIPPGADPMPKAS